MIVVLKKFNTNRPSKPMVPTYGKMQTQRLVTLAPFIAKSLRLLHDQRGNMQLL